MEQKLRDLTVLERIIEGLFFFFFPSIHNSQKTTQNTLLYTQKVIFINEQAPFMQNKEEDEDEDHRQEQYRRVIDIIHQKFHYFECSNLRGFYAII